MLWCESSKDCILLGLIDSDTYLHEFGKLVQNKCEWFHHESNSGALHATFNSHYWNIVSLRCQSSPVIWQSAAAARSVSTSCGNDTADLPLITNEAQRGRWEPSEGARRHPEVERWSTDPLLLTSYTNTCLQRLCVKRFDPVHVGCRSALVSREILARKKQ